MNCSQPVVVDDANLFISSAPGSGAALLEITRTGEEQIQFIGALPGLHLRL